ncbi:DinB family protein [Jatrophihabitans sp.]|uniref:DinB family protein n=1 Tax=Jatrophihabitans sp. TaxID=1932789 RepID=UPI0030C74538|nr:hypothetical protein [Jatrophihabitans sp.]
MWTSPAPSPVDGPLFGADTELLPAYLDHQRATLLNICAGLTGEQLALRPIPSSNLSLLGLVRHMAKVERTWFRIRAAQEEIEPVYDLALGKDHDFDDVDAALAAADVQRLRQECVAARAAAAGLSLDRPVQARDAAMSLRMVYLHMIGEYARHNGHADLLREAIDGVTNR